MGVSGWIATLIFCAASAIRLARFNVQSVRDEGATKADPYFTGLPTPAAACLMLLPLVISFQSDALSAVARAPWLVLTMTGITSALMVSRLPTPSIKYMRLSREHRVTVGFLGGLLAALLIAWPWATLTGVLLVYIATIPVAVFVHHPKTAAMRAAKSTHL
jgi:CDP-diacylglycerol--serine O-phosphatidyltransferase